jgi:DMSO/TMAO reductase YedYZ molybdopterin-dependent catalytic subunit
MTDSSGAQFDISQPVTVVGDSELSLDAESVLAFPPATRSVEIVCATGNRYTAEWVGIRITDLSDAVDAPADTTHFVVESLDGYRIAVPIVDGIDGVLAFEKDGLPVGETNPYPNRFVAPDIDGARDVKGVSRIEFHALEPDEDPDALEQVEPDDDRFEAERE